MLSVMITTLKNTSKFIMRDYRTENMNKVIVSPKPHFVKVVIGCYRLWN
jgi:23S rRNA U2552 (ribose-2'-O)-methylase RlmE/FtsJ